MKPGDEAMGGTGWGMMSMITNNYATVNVMPIPYPTIFQLRSYILSQCSLMCS